MVKEFEAVDLIKDDEQDIFENLKYAQVIQRGIFPKDRHFEILFEEHFILYRPKHLISGDFYWIGRLGKYKCVAVGDCTGHGISAGLISVLTYNLLNYALYTKQYTNPSDILSEVDKKFLESFSSDIEGVAFNNDWVDLSICVINEEENILSFAGARRKLMHVFDNEFNIYKGANYPIGGWQIETNRNFETVEVEYKKGDKIYLGSDGFQDQMGGEKNKKFKTKRLHNLLLKDSVVPMKEQLYRLQKEFLLWKNDQQQQDDVCIIGVKL